MRPHGLVREAGANMIGALKAIGEWTQDLEHQSDISEKMELLRKKHEPTYRHCVRAAWLAEKLADAMSLDAATGSKLVRGCFVHDLGKLLIPSSVLDNVRPLTEEQWELIRKHPEFGVELLGNKSELGPDIVKLILHHHERWDGKGYPYGLAGEKIPLLARACAVVDAFDSMLSPRPYRRKKTVEEAMEELRKNAGAQFDPRIAEKFIPLAGEVSKIYFSDN